MRLRRIQITLALSLVAPVACGDSGAAASPTPPTPTVQFPRVGQRAISGQVSAVIDGQPWTATDLVAITADTEDRFVINAVEQSLTAGQLILVIRPVLGTQTLSAPQSFGQLTSMGAFWSASYGGGGTVVVDTAIQFSATFSP